MSESTIPVDLRNPGQVMACLGLMEAAAILFAVDELPASVSGRYTWEEGSAEARFTLTVVGDTDPVLATVSFLAQATVRSVVPGRLGFRTEEWQVPTRVDDTDCFPFPPPNSPAPLPVVIVGVASGGIAKELPIEYWGDSNSTGRDNVKFWGGTQGRPGAKFADNAIQLLAQVNDNSNSMVAAAGDPFAFQARMSSSFRFDWRRDYVSLDAGFSPNRHKGNVVMVGYPLVELLAAIGLQHARPQCTDRREKLNYRYSVAAAALPLPFARAVLGGQSLGFPARTFRMRLGCPGQEGQARCILDAQEDIT